MEINRTTISSLNIVLHMMILFTFLSIFFFAYISKVEEQTFKDEIGGLLEKSIMNAMQAHKEQITPVVHQIKPALVYIQNQYSTPERVTLRTNIMIKFLAAFTVLLLLCIFITIVLTSILECKHSVPVGKLVIENVILFIFVGIVEYMFFTNIAIKYIPSPPTLLVKTIINRLKEKLE